MQEATCTELCQSINMRFKGSCGSRGSSSQGIVMQQSGTDLNGFHTPHSACSRSSSASSCRVRGLSQDEPSFISAKASAWMPAGPRNVASLRGTEDEMSFISGDIPLSTRPRVAPVVISPEISRDTRLVPYPPTPCPPITCPPTPAGSPENLPELPGMSGRVIRNEQSVSGPISGEEKWSGLVAELLNATRAEATVNSAWKFIKHQPKTSSTASLGRHARLEGANATEIVDLDEGSNFDRIFRSLEQWVWHPHSRRRIGWDIVGILVCVYELIIFPVRGAFVLPSGFAGLQKALDVFSALYWTIDVFLTFITAYPTSAGLMETKPAMIAKRYLLSWFSPDACMGACDWILLTYDLFGTGEQTGSMRIGKSVTRCLRLVRVFRLIKARERLTEVCGQVSSGVFVACLIVLRPFFVLLFLNHYAACAWYALSVMWSNGWTEKVLGPDHHPSQAYAIALHWALAQFSLGTVSSVCAGTTSEHLFAAALAVGALFSFSYFGYGFNTGMQQLGILDRCAEEEAAVRRYLSENKITMTLALRVNQFLRQKQGMSHRRRLDIKDVPSFRMLPRHIQKQLAEQAYSARLGLHPLFHVLQHLEVEAMQMLYLTGLEEKFMLPEEEMFGKDDVVDRMLFNLTGTLVYERQQDSPPSLTLETFRANGGVVVEEKIRVLPTQWVCEDVLWAAESRVEGPFIACGGSCQLLTLAAETFRKLALRSFCHETRNFLSVYAKHFVKSFNDVASCRTSDPEDCLFNNGGCLLQLVKQAAQGLLPSKTLYGLVEEEQEDASDDAVPVRRYSTQGLFGYLQPKRRSIWSPRATSPSVRRTTTDPTHGAYRAW
eukprot:TRINITY_DN33433_c0_g1_i1.p1 TRINITY_DN33433_c0_g1~~TRINITY_DN33433_c0_g1_i1.p1  ORF type:complete len:910 (-),score=118.40 TRINITY_DN33433_c0_g1_i1:37-2535(-)